MVSSRELESQPGNLAEALQRLRLGYFVGDRTVHGFYIGESWQPIGELRRISSNMVWSVRWLDRTDTALLHGPLHPGPVLEVSFRVGSDPDR